MAYGLGTGYRDTDEGESEGEDRRNAEPPGKKHRSDKVAVEKAKSKAKAKANAKDKKGKRKSTPSHPILSTKRKHNHRRDTRCQPTPVLASYATREWAGNGLDDVGVSAGAYFCP